MTLACAVAAAGHLFGLRTAALIVAALAAAGAAAGAGYALTRSAPFVTVRWLGPAVTIAGAVITATAVTIAFSIGLSRRTP